MSSKVHFLILIAEIRIFQKDIISPNLTQSYFVELLVCKKFVIYVSVKLRLQEQKLSQLHKVCHSDLLCFCSFVKLFQYISILIIIVNNNINEFVDRMYTVTLERHLNVLVCMNSYFRFYTICQMQYSLTELLFLLLFLFFTFFLKRCSVFRMPKSCFSCMNYNFRDIELQL